MIRLIRTQSTRPAPGLFLHSRDTQTKGNIRRVRGATIAGLRRSIRKSQHQIAFARAIAPALREPLLTHEQLAEEFIREMNRDELHQAATILRDKLDNRLGLGPYANIHPVNICRSAGLDGVKGGAS